MRGRLIVVTNDSFGAARAAVASGRSPRQQLWGTDHLSAAGWSIDPVPRSSWRWARWLSRRLRAQLGDLEAQLRVAVRLRGAAALVALEPGVVRGLSLLRRAGLVRVPLVVVAHPGRPTTGPARTALRGADEVIGLSRAITAALVTEVGRDSRHTVTAWWGADADDPRYVATGEDGGVVAAGRTVRDHRLLIEATGRLGVPVTIVARPPEDGGPGEPDPPHVRRVVATEHADIVAELAAATVVAIPLERVDGTFGLTELCDAMALGKPVVMTSNEFIDLRPSAHGFGREAPAGDIAAFAAALDEVLSDRAERSEMGRRARRLAEQHDIDDFGETLAAAVERATSGRQSRRRLTKVQSNSMTRTPPA